MRQVTTEGIAYLNNKIEQILDEEYDVISEKAGVRPTVRDRKPFLGEHPKHKKLAIFNGLGTRGVIQGPYLSAQFSNFLTASQKISHSVDIQRFKNIYSLKFHFFSPLSTLFCELKRVFLLVS